MYTLKYNPVLHIVAAILGAISGLRVWRFITDPPSFNYSFFFAWHVAVIFVSMLALVLLSLRPHIIVNNQSLTIRENLFKRPIEVQISDIFEAVWGKQNWGFWTRGRQLFWLKLKNDQELHFRSLSTLTNKKRNELFQRLRDAGVIVIIE